MGLYLTNDWKGTPNCKTDTLNLRFDYIKIKL